MTPIDPHRARAALLLAIAAMATFPASAASDSASSVASSASSTASSASDSLKTSSNSSKRTVAVADGDYRIAEVAAVPERPGTLRLLLQPVVAENVATNVAENAASNVADAAADEGAAFYLYLPQQTAQQSRLAVGATLSARQRPYGLSFARADDGRAFFLVLADDWQRELPSHAVSL